MPILPIIPTPTGSSGTDPGALALSPLPPAHAGLAVLQITCMINFEGL